MTLFEWGRGVNRKRRNYVLFMFLVIPWGNNPNTHIIERQEKR
jgi:hypothetical protein